MVGISLQDDVKRSFEKVKEDILTLKRSLNRELLAVEELSGRFNAVVVKDEFYSFVKSLGERLDRIDDSLEAYLGYEDDIKNVDAKVNSLGKKLSRQEDLGSEVKEVRRLNGKLDALEGSAVSAQKFNEGLGKVLSDVSSVRSAMLTGKALDGLKARLSEAEKKVESLEKSVPSRTEVSGSADAVEELGERLGKIESGITKKVEALEGSTISAQKFSESIGKVLLDVSSVRSAMLTSKALDSLKSRLNEAEKKVECVERESRKRIEEIEKEANKKLEDISGSLMGDIGSVRANSVDKSAFEKNLKELRKEDASIRGVLESSVSEVDFSDYVTRKELGKKLLVLEELNSALGKVARNAVEVEKGLELLRNEAASIDDVKSIGSDVKEISKSIDTLKAVMERVSDSSQKRFAQDLEQAKARFEKDLERLRDDFEDKLKKVEKEKAPANGGLLARVGKGVADFFREEDDSSEKKEKKGKPTPTVSELLKGEEKKKPGKGPGFGSFLMIAIIMAVIIAGIVFVFWFANRPESIIEPVQPFGVNESPVGLDAINASNEPVANETVPAAEAFEGNVSESAPAEVSGKNATTSAPGTVEYCRESYECKARGDGGYWFSCYLDEVGTCRCFVTDAEGCGIAQEVSKKPEAQAAAGNSNFGYAIAVGIVFALFLAVYISVLRNRRKNGKKPKKKEKETEKEEENGVDLEEFFHKK